MQILQGCKSGDECRYKHPRTTGKCLCCGAGGALALTSSQPSSSAKPKAQPKKKGGKGGGKGKKDKPSVKSSAKSSAKAGEVSFDNDDAEEEEHDAVYDWDETEEYVAEEEQEDTFAERAFATAYHSHVCEVCDPDDGEFVAPMGDLRLMGSHRKLYLWRSTGPRMRMR